MKNTSRCVQIGLASMLVLGLLAVQGCSMDDNNASDSSSSSSSSSQKEPDANAVQAPENAEQKDNVPLVETDESSSKKPSSSESSNSKESDDSNGASSATEGSGNCQTNNLAAQVQEERGSAGSGSVGMKLELKNNGDAACTLDGYPGVSSVDDKDQVGADAQRDAEDWNEPITIEPGQSAVAQMKVDQPGQRGCQAEEAKAFRIYPPNNKESIDVPYNHRECAGNQTPLITVGTFKKA